MNRQQLIEDNMNLVHFIISKHYPTFIGDEDIAQCGMIGLCRAADTWKDDKSAFSTYASKCILNEIYDEFKRRCRHKEVWSLDYPIRNEDGETTASGDLVVGDDGVDFVDDKPFYDRLNKTEQMIVDYKKLGYTNAEIAKKLDCSVNNVTHYLRKIRRIWRLKVGN